MNHSKKTNNNDKLLCSDCEANPAEYKLINGQEITCHCSPCMQSTLLSLAVSNHSVHIINKGEKDNLTTFELQ